jgi:hypothetical protein
LTASASRFACAVTAALVAVPAGAAGLLGDGLSSALLGEGADITHAFRDKAQMQRREPYTVEVDWSTTTASAPPRQSSPLTRWV